MTVRLIITLALGIQALWLAFHYNMHMFQLNVYLNNEQREWLQKNRHMQWILDFAAIFGAVRLLIAATGIVWLDWIAEVIAWLTLLVIILVYRLLKEMNLKKPLVFTARVKRMAVSDAVLCVLIAVLAVAIAGLAGGFSDAADNDLLQRVPLSAYLLLITGLQKFMVMAANTVNKPIEKGINQHYINDARRILAEYPDLLIIGVTGSYGKTSVKFYLETLLKQKFNVLVTPESYNTPMGVVKTIRGMLRPVHEIFVCEMGARYVGEIKELCDIVHPKHGIITSIGPQHLDTFGSIENIQKTKFELADALPDDGILFLNGDNEYIADELKEKRAIPGKLGPIDDPEFYHSEKIGKGYYASDIKVSDMGTSFTVTTPARETQRFSMKLVGAHNVINVMGAIAVANRLGIDLKELRVPVRRLRPVPHRMELKTKGDVTIIDDAFNSNPIGSKAAVETLALFSGMRILITPGMVELGADEDEYNRRFGTYAAKCCDKVLLVGSKHTEPIKEGLLSEGFDERNIEVFDRVTDAIDFAYGIRTGSHKYILLENDLPDNY